MLFLPVSPCKISPTGCKKKDPPDIKAIQSDTQFWCFHLILGAGGVGFSKVFDHIGASSMASCLKSCSPSINTRSGAWKSVANCSHSVQTWWTFAAFCSKKSKQKELENLLRLKFPCFLSFCPVQKIRILGISVELWNTQNTHMNATSYTISDTSLTQKGDTKRWHEGDTCDTCDTSVMWHIRGSWIVSLFEFPSDVAPPAARRHIAALPPEPRAATEAAEAGHGHASGGDGYRFTEKIPGKIWCDFGQNFVSKTPAECVMWLAEIVTQVASKLRIASSPPIWSNLSALSCPL